jgi:uncharacterized protein YdhG (YjbR/CyaY superfamily)
MKTSNEQSDAEKQFQRFIAKFEKKYQALIHAVRKALRKRFPTAHELVYDNYNFFVIGYSPTERPSDAIISIAAGASGIGLCFIQGAKLPDPKKILLGSGKQTRFVRLPSAEVLVRPEIDALLKAAAIRAKSPFPSAGRGKLVIRSVSAKQRPRRKTSKSASKKNHSPAVTIDAYIAGFPAKVQAVLNKIRSTIRKAAPQAKERISYRMPAFFQDGVLIYFAAFKNHIGVYPPVRGDAKLLKGLSPYRGEKGNLQFPLDEPLPYGLIRRIVMSRLKEREEKTGSKRAKQ